MFSPARAHNLPVTLKIHALSSDGRGIARDSDNMVVFVSSALPGQVVKAIITRRAKNFSEAYATSILDSPPLASPICNHVSACGGCPLQLLPYERQLFWKQDLLRNTIMRIGRLPERAWEQSWLGLLPSPLTSGFRNKITFAFGTYNGELILGQRKYASHEIVPVACPLLPAAAASLLEKLAEYIKATGLRAPLLRFLTLRHGRTLASQTPLWHILLLTGPATRAQRRTITSLGENLLGCDLDIASFCHEERYAQDLLAVGEKRIISLSRDSSPIVYDLMGKSFCLGPASFFQVNSMAAQLWAKSIFALIGEREGKLLDLYCGVGSPGQLLDGFEECAGLEYAPESARWAQLNAKMHSLHKWSYHAGDAAQTLRKIKNLNDYATVLADPPRQGIQKDVLLRILAARPRRIIYISCNPATLARDAGVLGHEYELKKIQAIDMFPHTPHLETCTLWQRR